MIDLPRPTKPNRAGKTIAESKYFTAEMSWTLWMVAPSYMSMVENRYKFSIDIIHLELVKQTNELGLIQLPQLFQMHLVSPLHAFTVLARSQSLDMHFVKLKRWILMLAVMECRR